MQRQQRLREIIKSIGKRSLLWLGSCSTYASPLLHIPQLSDIFAITAPLEPAGNIYEVCLETMVQRRFDSLTYDLYRDNSQAAARFHRLLYKALGKPVVALTDKPYDFFTTAYLPQAENIAYLGIVPERQAALNNKPWVERELRKHGVRTIPWDYYGKHNIKEFTRRLKKGPHVVRLNALKASSSGTGITIVREPDEMGFSLLNHPDALIAASRYLQPNIPPRYLQKHGPANVCLESIMTNSEQLFDHQRELFRKVFKCDTYSRYGAWEMHVVAAECTEHQGYHIAAEDAVVEIVDESGKPVPAGVEGRILLTNLHNYAMPFIRYDIGDTAALSDKICDCGRVGLPLLVNLNGRADAVIVTPSGKHIPGRSLPGGRFFAGMGIVQYQIVQEIPDELVFNLALDIDCHPATQESITRNIEAKYHSILGPDMTLKMHFVNQILPDKSGKRNVVVSRLPGIS